MLKQLGFGQEDGRGHGESFALLDDADIDAKVPGDLRDHPLLLLPRDSRQRLFEGWSADGFEDEHILGDYLVEGDLSPRSRSIFDALLNAYRGDLRRVLQHVQIERFFLSRRYRRGLVAIEPQMHVDASIRQLTMDQGIQSLPPSLRLLSMYEPGGDLVDANRGFIEYNDLLKKPIDAYKYLLATCEKGTVSLPNAILHLDQVFLASSNELHLAAFKEYPDFTSFKGRMDLVKVPYLRDYTVEVGIYDEQVARDGWEHVSPHATTVLALWAVLTRLRRPVLSHYPTEVREILANLAPLQKATLYAGLGVPHALSPEQERELLALVPELLAEGQDGASYEGSAGASPREMKEVMLNALQNEAYHGLSALAVFEELRDLVKNKSVYEFLNQEVDNGYQDHEGFIDVVFEWWLDRTSLELRDALGLVGARQYEELFARYILHVSYALKGEKIYSEATGRSEEPDTHLMAELESVWKVGSSPERFRRDLVARVGAWRVDNRGEEIAYRELFAHLVQQLEDDYFARQRETIRKVTLEVLQVLGAENETLPYEACSDVDRERVEDVISRLEAIGYPRASIRETLAVLVKHRYA